MTKIAKSCHHPSTNRVPFSSPWKMVERGNAIYVSLLAVVGLLLLLHQPRLVSTSLFAKQKERVWAKFSLFVWPVLCSLKEWLWFELRELVVELFFFENMRSEPFLLQVLLPPPPLRFLCWSHCCLVWCLLHAWNVWEEAMVHRRVIVVWMNPSPEFLRVSFWPRWLQSIRCRLRLAHVQPSLSKNSRLSSKKTCASVVFLTHLKV